ncbi:MAG: hypothetical protein V3574_03915 [Candidatus Moraniibacteriota bacterium]
MSDKKISSSWKFLLVVGLIYGSVFAFKRELALEAWGDFIATLGRVLPVVGIVFGAMFILNLFLRQAIIKKHLGRDSGIKGWIYTIIGSIFVVGPPYFLMPMLSELRSQGMKTSLTAVFLSNRSVQPVYLPVMASYFGWKYALLVSFFIISFSILSGLIVGKTIKE